jgi:hypothetical protein
MCCLVNAEGEACLLLMRLASLLFHRVYANNDTTIFKEKERGSHPKDATTTKKKR